MKSSKQSFNRVGPFTLAIALAASLALSPRARAATPEDGIKITADRVGVYEIGQPVTWTIAPGSAEQADPIHYRISENNFKTLEEGTLKPGQTLTAKLDEPGQLLLRVDDTKSKVFGMSGVIVAPEKLKPAAAAPDDFDAFWKEQIAAIKKVPANPQITPGESEKAGVDYFDVLLDNVDGAKVHAQLARPTKGDKFPAIVLLQYAGVYPLPKTNVTRYASQGWLALDVMAHDLPLHEDKAYYAKVTAPGASLANYVTIGDTSRDTSYFRHMFLGDYQAIEWLRTRPDWDGHVLVLRGDSQGGLQSIALAGLDPNVTAVVTVVPAGCDTFGKQAGRMPGWPYWFAQGKTDAQKKEIMNTSRYYDTSNFAPQVKCPTMVAVGLRDMTACAPGDIGMANVLGGPHELVYMPKGTHTREHPEGAERAGEWLASLLKTGSPPTK